MSETGSQGTSPSPVTKTEAGEYKGKHRKDD